MQPPALPREDIDALGVKYRRIPIMSIGRDIYCDTRLILRKLEERFPTGALGASHGDQRALEILLEKWTIDGGVFLRATQLIPPQMPLLNDPKWVKDREEFMSRSWAKADIARARPEAIAHMRDFFDLVESTILADGRAWILDTERPSMADINGKNPAIWPFHWLVGMQGALPPSLFGKVQFPKIYAWLDRFDKAVKDSKKFAPKVTTLKGAEAIQYITQAEFAEPEGNVDAEDPLGLEKGQYVESWPIDSGFRHRDSGQLVALTRQEVVLKTQAKIGHRDIHIHHPRTNFRIQAAGGAKL
ncbi:MAG: hypothetical protein LQ352_001089 [Teloschistes flavicans]|nr:MAG: hypothetical protein LQ352_001089 [Teloschistes flavicans]